MTSNHPIDTDRENLCALFDGQLEGDAARFALKRLGHDVQWRETCGRWQLYGDVLRGQAGGVAGAGFAERVAAALAAEASASKARDAAAPMSAAAMAPARRTGSPSVRRGWIGGAALAASVAVAALFVARPNDPAAEAADASRQVAAQTTTAPSSTVPLPVSPVTAPTAVTPGPTSPDAATAATLGSAALAVVERRNATTRSQNQRRAQTRAQRHQDEAPLMVASSGGAAAAVSAVAAAEPVPGTRSNPFGPGHNESPVSRPWPRAVLPDYPATGGSLTASYGSSLNSPSFFPFGPAPESAATPVERSGPTTESRGPQP